MALMYDANVDLRWSGKEVVIAELIAMSYGGKTG
jgi:hypothetical protein